MLLYCPSSPHILAIGDLQIVLVLVSRLLHSKVPFTRLLLDYTCHTVQSSKAGCFARAICAMRQFRKLIHKAAQSLVFKSKHGPRKPLDPIDWTPISTTFPTAIMADQEEDYSSLPLTDRFTHKVRRVICTSAIFHCNILLVKCSHANKYLLGLEST